MDSAFQRNLEKLVKCFPVALGGERILPFNHESQDQIDRNLIQGSPLEPGLDQFLLPNAIL